MLPGSRLRCRQALGDGVGVADALVDDGGHDDAGVHQGLLGLANERTSDWRGIEQNGNRSAGLLGNRHGPGNGRQVQQPWPAGNQHEIRCGGCGACRARDVWRGIKNHDLDAGLPGGVQVAA